MGKCLFRKMVVLLLFLSILLSGGVIAPQTARGLSIAIDNSATCETLEEYHEALEQVWVSDHFIYYEDISFIGEFAGYRGNDFDIYNQVRYTVRDESGSCVTVGITKLPYEVKDVLSMDVPKPVLRMPKRESFYHSPADPETQAVSDVVYLWEDALYYYNIGTDQAILGSVQWVYANYLIRFSLGSPDKSGDEVYPEDEKDTLMGRLLDPDTAKGAMAQVNLAIFWRQFRVAVKNAAPVLIGIACVVAVGGTVLLLRRKKKKQEPKAPAC